SERSSSGASPATSAGGSSSSASGSNRRHDHPDSARTAPAGERGGGSCKARAGGTGGVGGPRPARGRPSHAAGGPASFAGAVHRRYRSRDDKLGARLRRHATAPADDRDLRDPAAGERGTPRPAPDVAVGALPRRRPRRGGGGVGVAVGGRSARGGRRA